MIERKKKICKAGHEAYLFSHGYCKYHWMLIKAKEKKPAKELVHDRDLKFYTWIWNNREHYCEECGAELNEFNIDLFHHCLGKKKYPYFRYESKNIFLLCGKFGCHQKAENAVAYPKMKLFTVMENRKFELLESVGVSYTPKYFEDANNI